jgi:hypothetical protein
MKKSKPPKLVPLKLKLRHPCLKLCRSNHLTVVQHIAGLGLHASMKAWVSEVARESLAMGWPGITVDQRLTFRGDTLELLTEYLMRITPVDSNQGLSGYTPVGLRDDYGVDAVGVKNGVTVAVQCKFRKNPQDLIHYADLARTFTQGVVQFGLDPAARDNVWLVTTAEDANHQCKHVLGRHLHVLGLSHLKKNLDGNTDFWQGFLASI